MRENKAVRLIYYFIPFDWLFVCVKFPLLCDHNRAVFLVFYVQNILCFNGVNAVAVLYYDLFADFLVGFYCLKKIRLNLSTSIGFER